MSGLQPTPFDLLAAIILGVTLLTADTVALNGGVQALLFDGVARLLAPHYGAPGLGGRGRGRNIGVLKGGDTDGALGFFCASASWHGRPAAP